VSFTGCSTTPERMPTFWLSRNRPAMAIAFTPMALEGANDWISHFAREFERQGRNRRHVKESQDYILATGASAVPRLRLLNEIFGPASRQLLLRAGLRQGCRVAEVGCGTGLMALWIAEQAGTEGSLSAVDMSREQLQIAEAHAKAAGLEQISFQQATAYDTRLAHGAFDLVYSRFLMCHLTRPAEALTHMRALLKAGGTLVCEDYEMSAVRTFPATSAYTRLLEISRRIDEQRGVDSDVGSKLHSLILKARFQRPEVEIQQPAFLRGEPKRFWELTLREAAGSIVESGAASAEDLEPVLAEMDLIARDDTTLVLVARVFQVWGRKE
jgi:2-polyprenyl-3-methyl-5-hydroxy-6-metoxy-1,4-benzoquinol methylase